MQALLGQFGPDEGASGADQSLNDGHEPSVRVINDSQRGAIAPLELEPPTPQVCCGSPSHFAPIWRQVAKNRSVRAKKVESTDDMLDSHRTPIAFGLSWWTIGLAFLLTAS